MKTPQELIAGWVKIGKQNIWIGQVGSGNPEYDCAFEEPFSVKSLHKCNSTEELKEKFSHGNWSLGQGFYFENLCFINQIDGGDEWLTIKDNVAFESFTWEWIIKDGKFDSYMRRLLTASIEQCRSLEY